jgi:hypothetical protein
MCITGPLCSPVLGAAAWRSGEWPIFLMFVIVTLFMGSIYPGWVRGAARSLRRRINGQTKSN